MPSYRFKSVALIAALAAAPLPAAMAEAAGPAATRTIAVASLSMAPAMAPAMPQAAPVSQGFSAEKAGFAIHFKEHTSPYKVISTFVLPGEQLQLAAIGNGDYQLTAAAGQAQQSAAGKWLWQAPEQTGLYPVTIRRSGSNDAITLNVFVMVPYSRMRDGVINGYRIGAYPARAPIHAQVYKRPAGFIEVTKENENTYIAPHFQLKQFLCKEKGGYPKYIVLQEKLLLKLELLLAKVNEREFRANTFTIMSGYRTPAYNQDLGNVKFSAHQYGMAADIYIDGSHSGAMDDLNGDGRIDYRDAEALYKVADRLHVGPGAEPLVGGLGKYKPTRAHGPFVHVDVRGFKARWARS